MKTNTKQRALRILLSSILGSDLKMRELQELAEAFLTGSDFSQELGIMIKNLALDLKIGSDIKKQGPPYNFRNQEYSLEDAINLIKKKRIPKKHILSAISEVSPKAGSHYASKKDNMTIRQIIEKFYHVHGRELFYDFMALLLRGDKSQDEYLKGIMQEK